MRELFRLKIGPQREVTIPQKLLNNLAIAEGDELRIETDGSAITSFEAHKGDPLPSLFSPEMTTLLDRRERELAASDSVKIGDVEHDGKHKGEIYGGIWSKEYGGDNKPIWFLAAPRLMNHYNAAAWAEGQGGSLPTRKQGDYLTTLKGKGGAFTEIFNRGKRFPAGYIWLAEPRPNSKDDAWCQRLSDGDLDVGNGLRNLELPVLSVRR